MSHLSLEKQAATWFLGMNTNKNDVMWQFNASNLPFFGEAVIAMGRGVRMLHAPKDIRKARTELANAFFAQHH
jgi:hypothetical protein